MATTSLSIQASAVVNQPDSSKYFDIVTQVSEKYGIEINFRPNPTIEMPLDEFEELVEEYAKQTFYGNQNSDTAAILSQSQILPQNVRASGPERVSKTTQGYRVSANAYYRWNAANEIYLYTTGNSVQVVAANFLLMDYFTIDSSSCSAIDLGRTLYVTTTGTAHRYNSGMGWLDFPNTTLTVQIYYTALSVNS